MKLTYLILLSLFLACGNQSIPEEQDSSKNEQLQSPPIPADAFQNIAGAAYSFDHGRTLGQQELTDKTPDELARMRNEIFAHHGYRFQTDRWRNYFAQAGFPAEHDDVNAMLSETDKANVSVIVEREQALRSSVQADENQAIGIDDLVSDTYLSPAFKTFLGEFLAAANQGDDAFIEAHIYPGFQGIDAAGVINQFGTKKVDDEYQIVTYLANACAHDYCKWCGEELGIPFEWTERYTFGVLYESLEPDAIRDASMVDFLFVESPNSGWQLYCMSAAG